MKRISILVIVAAGFAGLLATAAASATDIDKLDWLTGCWAGDGSENHYEECWLHPAGGTMLGLNRTVSDGGTAHEFLRIGAHDEELAYFASPQGRAPVAFQLIEIKNGVAVFANPEHDFPQRITYRRVGERLTATVEALEEGDWKGFEIIWRRSSLDH